VTVTTPATVTNPPWPTEIDIVFATGSKRLLLSLQSRLLWSIFHGAFENVHSSLVFENAFPNAIAIPSVVRRSLVASAEVHEMVGGHYNNSAACVHQRLLSNDNYQASMLRLVSTKLYHIKYEWARLIIISAACTHFHLSIGCQGPL